MNSFIKIIFFIIILVIIFDNFFGYNIEFFDDSIYLSTHTQFPFWNTQIGTTRNMSYDLRGDIPPHLYYTGPWNISPHYPIYNRPLWL